MSARDSSLLALLAPQHLSDEELASMLGAVREAAAALAATAHALMAREHALRTEIYTRGGSAAEREARALRLGQ